MCASASKVQAPPRLLVARNRGRGLELPAVALSGLLVADGPGSGQLEGVRGAVWRRGGWRQGATGMMNQT